MPGRLNTWSLKRIHQAHSSTLLLHSMRVHVSTYVWASSSGRLHKSLRLDDAYPVVSGVAWAWLENLKSTPKPSTGLGRQYVLEPVAVGTPLDEAPLQTTELLNVGEAAVSYKVESNGIKRANNSQGHGMPVRFVFGVFFRGRLAVRIHAGQGASYRPAGGSLANSHHNKHSSWNGI